MSVIFCPSEFPVRAAEGPRRFPSQRISCAVSTSVRLSPAYESLRTVNDTDIHEYADFFVALWATISMRAKPQ